MKPATDFEPPGLAFFVFFPIAMLALFVAEVTTSPHAFSIVQNSSS
jgi:hypothetical protein